MRLSSSISILILVRPETDFLMIFHVLLSFNGGLWDPDRKYFIAIVIHYNFDFALFLWAIAFSEDPGHL